VWVSPCAYRGGMSSSARGVGAIVIYTVMRLGLLLGVWWLIQLVSPLRGLWALVVAVLVSGVISWFALDRQRSAMSAVVGGFFGRINDRIEAASRAEDEADDQAQRERYGVDGHQHPGTAESGDKVSSDGAAGHDSDGTDRPRDTHQPE